MKIAPLQEFPSVKCPLHPRNTSNILCVSADIASRRACESCIIEGNMPASAAVSISDLF